MMDEQQRNLILAIALSILVFIGWEAIMGKRVHPTPPAQTVEAPQSQPAAPAPAAVAPAPSPMAADTLPEAPRIRIDTPRLKGSLSLAGGRIDDLTLADYFETSAHDKPVTLLSPAGADNPYFVEFGWTPQDPNIQVPNSKTIWNGPTDHALTPDHPVTLTWDNGAGLSFERTISVDPNYLFRIVDKVTNRGSAPVVLKPYGRVVRVNPPTTKEAFGPAPSVAGAFNGALEEVSYKELADKGSAQYQSKGGWVGMNDRYWLVAAAPPSDENIAAVLSDAKSGTNDRYSADYQASPAMVAPGATAEQTSQLFAGAKEQKLLDQYQDTAGIDKLDRTVDFGSFFLIAKPFSLVLDFIGQHLRDWGVYGSFGIAILVFNVILKTILFPLQDRSFHQMARMRDLQPKIAQLKERFGDDREKMATAQMELFRREKINPASGCLPQLLQIPIFFALYRVLITSIEMRQAPFYGWIHDLSAPDPTTIFNLFGLIPWAPPAVLMIGAWPILYAGSLYLQQKMTPTPTTDPTQQRIMALMPLMLLVFFRNFPAGLMIYYVWNNLLTIGQMYLIRRRAEARKAKAAGA
jgi:YidC/Oxa1 family membrane protein insertase